MLKKYFSFSYLVLLTLLSCSGDDNGSDDTESSNKLTSLTISSSVDQAIVGESIFFSVVDNTGALRTYEAKFYINNNQISGNTHLFNEVGTFEVYATYEDITSSKIEITITPITQNTHFYVKLQNRRDARYFVCVVCNGGSNNLLRYDVHFQYRARE